jgi:hypothetical protein
MSTRRDILMALPVLGAGWACLQPALGPSSGSLATVTEPARMHLAVAEPRPVEPAALRPNDARMRPVSLERGNAELFAAR